MQFLTDSSYFSVDKYPNEKAILNYVRNSPHDPFSITKK